MPSIYDDVTKRTMAPANIWLWHFVHKRWMTCWQKQQKSTICQSREQNTPWQIELTSNQSYYEYKKWRLISMSLVQLRSLRQQKIKFTKLSFNRNEHLHNKLGNFMILQQNIVYLQISIRSSVFLMLTFVKHISFAFFPSIESFQTFVWSIKLHFLGE